MSNVQLSGTQAFLARYEGLRDRMTGDSAARDAAAACFAESGLPSLHDEAWKYTSLRPIAEAAFHEPLTLLARCDDLLALAPDVEAPRLVFCGGRYRPDLSTEPEFVEIGSFSQDPVFGPLARPDREPMVALNTMLAEDGAAIHVPDGVDGGTLVLLTLGADVHGQPVASHPRHSIGLGARSRLALLEVSVGRGQYLHNAVCEVDLQDGAHLTHVRLQNESVAAFHVSTLYARVSAGAAYDSFAFNMGGRLARTEVHAVIEGPGGAVHLNGAQLLRGMQHADFTTVVRHAAPHGVSRQTVKNVLDGRARGVFQGKIEVARGAQKTDGYQMNQALLLSPDAEIDSKPELEIYADDVKCSHGATVGELDAEQLFYLRSRGIPEATARGMLVRAFLTEAIDSVAHEGARAMLEDAVSRWWQQEEA